VHYVPAPRKSCACGAATMSWGPGCVSSDVTLRYAAYGRNQQEPFDAVAKGESYCVSTQRDPKSSSSVTPSSSLPSKEQEPPMATKIIWPQDVADLVEMAREWPCDPASDAGDYFSGDVLIRKLGNALAAALAQSSAPSEAGREAIHMNAGMEDDHCDPCVTAMWCSWRGRCLAECLPSDAPPSSEAGRVEVQAVKERLTTAQPRCQWCGLEDHAGNCPMRRVRALEAGLRALKDLSATWQKRLDAYEAAPERGPLPERT
jgi:hypothetical protein